jgi:signal transduction histidine kinase
VIARIRKFVKREASQKRPLDLNEVVHEVVEMMRNEIHRHGVTWHIVATTGLPQVVADRVQLQQVLLNVLMNAVEAMAPVSKHARTLEFGIGRYGANALHVTVCDSGVGLHPAHRERVFDAFHTTKPGGMGMGLAISRSIIEAHGGRLWATANEGPGETFQFTLPVAPWHQS